MTLILCDFPLQARTGSVLKYLDEGDFRNCWFKIELEAGIERGEELSKYYLISPLEKYCCYSGICCPVFYLSLQKCIRKLLFQ